MFSAVCSEIPAQEQKNGVYLDPQMLAKEMKRPGKRWQEMSFLGNKNRAMSGEKKRLWLVTAFTAVLHLFSLCYQHRSDGSHHFNACATPAAILLFAPTCVCREKHQRFEAGLTEWSCSTAVCPRQCFCLIVPCEMNRGDPHSCGGVALSCFSSDAGLVSMLGATLLLFREISVRPSSQFISSHNHELSKLSYSGGSACRQVSVSTAAEPKYLLNPSSLFNYPRVLEK